MDKLYFKNLDEFIADVRDYRQELNKTTLDEQNNPVVTLLGIDGNPTTDDSILGNRQIIFEHFENLFDAYMDGADEPSLEGMHRAHSMALISYSAYYRKCVDYFDEIFNSVKSDIELIDKIKNELMSNTVPVKSIPAKEAEAMGIINRIYDLAFQMKRCYEGSQEHSITARLMNMVMGYTMVGREFFNDASFFEDTYTPCLNSMFKDFDSLRKILKFNARCASAKDMITKIN